MITRFLVMIILFFSSCNGTKKIPVTESGVKLRFIGQAILDSGLVFQNTVVGGLSAIDYDQANDIYYLLSDDASERSPTRFYKAKISITEKGIDSVVFKEAVSLLRKDGSVFPDFKSDPDHAPDPEGMRYNASNRLLVWSSEGDRIVDGKKNVLNHPFVYLCDLEGNFVDSFFVPGNFRVSIAEKGPRKNSAFEAISLSDDHRILWVGMEEPLYEDGPRAGPGDSAGWVRLIKFNTFSRKALGQFFYRIDPVVKPPVPAGAFRLNGLTDLLHLEKDRFLFVERSFSSGSKQNSIRVYEGRPRKTKRPDKKLVLNMDSLGIPIDNIEGVCFGPRLASGKRSLVFVSDNNFSPKQATQFLLFEIE